MSFVEKSKGKFAKYLKKHLSYAKQSTETFRFEKNFSIFLKFVVRIQLVSLCHYHFSSHSRLTILFYVLSGLDLLDALDELDCEQKSIIIEWIYKQQIHPEEQNDELFYQSMYFFSHIIQKLIFFLLNNLN